MKGSLLIIGSIFSILGLIITIWAIVSKKEEVLESKDLKNIRILSKGNPVEIGWLYTPTEVECQIEFRPKNKIKAIFSILRRDVKITHSGVGGLGTGTYQVLYGKRTSKGGKVTFKLEPGSEYILKVESSLPSITKEGLTKIIEIFKKYLEVKKEGGEYVIVLEKNKGGGYSVASVRKLIDMFHSTLYSKQRGQKLVNALIVDAKNTGYERRFEKWYSSYPTMFDEIADIVCSYSSGKSTTIADINYKLVKIKKLPNWVRDIGLTLIIIGVSVFLTGLQIAK